MTEKSSGLSMVERMARAMCAEDNGAGYDDRWAHYVHMALAALRELREPTDGMVRAVYVNGPYGMDETFAKDILTGAIDAVIAEREAGR